MVTNPKHNGKSKCCFLSLGLQILSIRRITMTKKPLGTTAKTGETCPESGVWKVEGNPSTTAPIAKGNKMPPYAQKAVTWKLTQYA